MAEIRREKLKKTLLLIFGALLAIVTIVVLITTIIGAQNGRISREDYLAHYFYIGIIIFFSLPPFTLYFIERHVKKSLVGPMANQARSPSYFITGLVITVFAFLLSQIVRLLIFPCEGMCVRGFARNFYLLPIVAIGIAFTVSGAMTLFSKKHPDNDKINVTLWIIYFVVLFVEDITFLFDVLL